MRRYFQGTKKCAFCKRELKYDEIKGYFDDDEKYLNMIDKDLITDEEQCPYCGYHNDFIEEESSELLYSIIT